MCHHLNDGYPNLFVNLQITLMNSNLSCLSELLIMCSKLNAMSWIPWIPNPFRSPIGALPCIQIWELASIVDDLKRLYLHAPLFNWSHSGNCLLVGFNCTFVLQFQNEELAYSCVTYVIPHVICSGAILSLCVTLLWLVFVKFVLLSCVGTFCILCLNLVHSSVIS